MNAWTTLETAGALYARASWQAACLVPAVLLAQRLLRSRLSPRWRYLLWLPVIARLALPWTPPSPVSLFAIVSGGVPSSLLSPAPVEAPPARSATRSTEPTPMPRPTAATTDERVRAATPRDLRSPARPNSPAATSFTSSRTGGASTVAPSVDNEHAAPDPNATALVTTRIPAVRPASWLAGTWMTGVAVFLGLALAAWRRLHVRAQRLRPVRDTRVLALWEECRERVRVRSSVRLVEGTGSGGPALLGGAGLWLLLPEGLAGRLSDDELRHVFLHELAHVRRGDPWINLVLLGIQALHWFNPMVWWALRRMRDDRELATDAMALDRSGSADPTSYGLTVVKLAAEFASAPASAGSVGILEGSRRIWRRVEAIAAARPGTRGPTPAWGVIAMAGLLMVGLTDARSSGEPAPREPRVLGRRGRDHQPPTTNGPMVRVTVVDTMTGAPIAGARVLSPSQAAMYGKDEPGSFWRTDAEGHAEIRLGAIPAERMEQIPFHTLSVRAPGYAPEGRGWSTASGDARTQVPRELTVGLVAGETLSGTVLDAEGRPVEGAELEVWGRGYRFEGGPGQLQRYPEFWSWHDGAGPIRTDAQGRWQVADYPTDLESVIVDVRRRGAPPERFIQAPDLAGAFPAERGSPLKRVELRAGTAVLRLPRGFDVSVRVTAPDGRPLEGARVREAFGAHEQKTTTECVTDADGRCVLPARTEREILLTAEAPGFAATSLAIVPGPGTNRAELRLGPPSPLRLLLHDDGGQPIHGAAVEWENLGADPIVTDFRAVTGPDGRVNWDQAPTGRLAFRITLPTGGRTRSVKVPAGERHKTVTVRAGEDRAIRVQGRVVDAETGRGLVVSAVVLRPLMRGTAFPEPFEHVTTGHGPGFRLEVPLDRFSQGIDPAFQLAVRVPPFGQYLTEVRRFDEGDWDIVLRVRPGGSFQGHLRLPDGPPAVGAQVVASTWDRLRPFLDGPARFWVDQHSVVATTDTNGRFALDDAVDEAQASHPEGFLKITAGMLATNSAPVLNRWGQIRGQLLIRGQAIPDAPVRLRAIGIEPSANVVGAWEQRTDASGRFHFTNVPPGLARLTRPSFVVHPADSHPVVLEVRPGEVLEVRYSIEGRRIEGRLPSEIDWIELGQSLESLPTLRAPEPADPDQCATEACLVAANQRYLDEHQRQSWARSTFVAPVASDGVSFRLEDVPPGRYELRLQGRPKHWMGRGIENSVPTVWTREIVVPEAPAANPTAVLQLGLVDVTRTAHGSPTRPR